MQVSRSSKYEGKRSNSLLKVKTFYDAEAKVIAHHKGSGKNSAVMGAVECVMECGKVSSSVSLPPFLASIAQRSATDVQDW